MSTGLQTNDPTIVSAFHGLLVREGLIVLLLVVLLAMAWSLLRVAVLRRAMEGTATEGAAMQGAAPAELQLEPKARQLLRVSFGLIWIFDGILQAQASMPLGMTPQVIGPGAAGSPSWVAHLTNFGGTIWSYHPITASASAVWIQVGIGIWLLTAPRGRWSRLGGLSSATWGIVVWVFGESFGGIFGPGLSWATGAPGAVLFYSVAGVLIALPDRAWTTQRLGRTLLAVMGSFFLGMAVLQAWPGRGFWQGQLHKNAAPGTLTTMVREMARTPQPRFVSSWVATFGSFDATHGWAVNLFLVVVLAVLGVGFLSGRRTVTGVAVIAGIVVCLADWVLIQDFGFFGGVGTDPNSMIPLALLFTAGYVAVTRVPLPATEGAPVVAPVPPSRSLWERLTARPTYVFQSFAAVAALGVTLIGAAPMALASINPNADPIVAQAVDGTPQPIHWTEPALQLTDQRGQAVSLRGLRGKAVALTFLDPVCVSDCPTIAQEFREADRLLGAAAQRVEFVAVVANPVYRSQAYLAAFDQQEGLAHVANWLYLTGSGQALKNVWNEFGVAVLYSPAGAMIAHSDIAFVIGPSGGGGYVLNMDPGPATEATESSSAVVLASEIRQLLGS
jgi:cytochrome oxidase Cu insertion factor (SCO1/SenC/PrrC family)